MAKFVEDARKNRRFGNRMHTARMVLCQKEVFTKIGNVKRVLSREEVTELCKKLLFLERLMKNGGLTPSQFMLAIEAARYLNMWNHNKKLNKSGEIYMSFKWLSIFNKLCKEVGYGQV